MASNPSVLSAREPEGERKRRVAFRSGDRTFFPRLDEVVWIQARRNYSEIRTSGGSFLVREVLASVERRLAAHGFVRVQRSWIVNVDHVVEIRRARRGRHAVVLTDGTEVEVTPAIRDLLEALLAPVH